MAEAVTPVTPITKGMGANRKRGPRRGDAWDLSDGGYDVERYYTASVVGEGESEKVGIRVDTSVWARVQGAVNSGKIPPYRSVHDLVRDAIVHRLHHIESSVNDPLLGEWLQMIVRQGNIDVKRRIMKAARETVQTHQEGFSEAEANKDWALAREMIEEARETIEELRSPYDGELERVTDEFERRVESAGSGQVKVQGRRTDGR